MFTRRLGGFFLLIPLITSPLSSCSPARTAPGPASVSGSVDRAAYAYHLWEEGLAILIWHDFAYGATGCTGTSSTEDPVYHLVCDVQAADGRRFEWEITTPDGETARMWVNDESYDLAEGAIFLISTRDGETGVTQLLRDMTAVKPEEQAILAFSQGDDVIAGFLESANLEELPGESLSEADAARAALLSFFDHLQAGDYAAAADLYAGSYETMIDHNPALDPADHAALWRAACEINGAQCLRIAGARLQEKPPLPEGEFHFEVEFQREDGSIFSTGPCCGEEAAESAERSTFTYRVRHQAEYLFQVLDPPVYTP